MFLVLSIFLVVVTAPAAYGGWIRLGANCRPDPVHREAAPGSSLSVPYVKARRAPIHGFLFYFGIPELASETEAVLYTKGRAPSDAATKILWTVPSVGGTGSLHIVGKRRFGRGHFSESFGPAGGTSPIPGTRQYPTLIRVPRPGCWQLTLRSGRFVGRLEFRVWAAQ